MVAAITIKTMVAVVEEMILVMMVLSMMVLVWDLLFSMHLLILIEMQVVCASLQVPHGGSQPSQSRNGCGRGGDGRHVVGDDGSTDDGPHLRSPLQYAPAKLNRDASHMLPVGALLQFPHGGSHRAQDSGGAAVVVVVLEEIFLAIMVPPMMVLIWVSSLVCAC
jgi:hypothetical protein